MCRDCGCGLPGENPAGISAHAEDHSPEEGHDHGREHNHEHEHFHEPGPRHGQEHREPHVHSHAHPHTHPPEGGNSGPSPEPEVEARRTVEVRRSILEKNDRQAERNRGFFRAHGLLVLNVLSSPGSGKTALLRETALALGPELRAGVIVGDLATDNDARRLRESGAPVVQVTTGTVCHLEAEMVSRAVKELALADLNLLIIENVGNLVCPAAYDLGEDLRVVLLSVTEGEDKPLKYPPIFQYADAVIISKIDLAAACGFDRGLAMSNLQRVAPRAPVFETSAKTGEGMDRWKAFLRQKLEERKAMDLRGP